MKPSTRIRVALRAALRRRYGFAALRVLRRGAARAAEQHIFESISTGVYNGEAESERIADEYRRALGRLRKRWPSIDFADPRSAP